mgnify:CR=1 FL=1
MVYSDIPQEWQQSLGILEKNSKLRMQAAATEIDTDLIRRDAPRQIVTYEPIVQKSRTLPPGPLLKRQVNKVRGFNMDKTQTPVQMLVKENNRVIDMTSTPGFSMGSQYTQSHNREFNYVTPKHNIINPHQDISAPEIISQLRGVKRVKPRKLLSTSNIYDPDREITNYTPIHQIDQPLMRVYNTL